MYIVMTKLVEAEYSKHPENEERYFAFMETVSKSDNIIPIVSRPNILHANIFTSRQEAEQIRDFWNYCYKKNGTYAF